MVLRRRFDPPPDLFPVDPWAIETRQFTGQYLREAETIFALANGLLGLRGNHEEGYPVGEPGTYVNGFYESRPIVYAEEAYGFPHTGQTMVNCPDGKIIRLYVDDEPFDVDGREVVSYRRRLDMRRATLERDLVWLTPSGRRVRAVDAAGGLALPPSSRRDPLRGDGRGRRRRHRHRLGACQSRAADPRGDGPQALAGLRRQRARADRPRHRRHAGHLELRDATLGDGSFLRDGPRAVGCRRPQHGHHRRWQRRRARHQVPGVTPARPCDW